MVEIPCDYSFVLELVNLNGKWMANITVNVTVRHLLFRFETIPSFLLYTIGHKTVQ